MRSTWGSGDRNGGNMGTPAPPHMHVRVQPACLSLWICLILKTCQIISQMVENCHLDLCHPKCLKSTAYGLARKTLLLKNCLRRDHRVSVRTSQLRIKTLKVDGMGHHDGATRDILDDSHIEGILRTQAGTSLASKTSGTIKREREQPP